MRKFDCYSIYVTLHASLGSAFYFSILDWVDSHSQKYYNSAYLDRWGWAHTTFFMIPSVLIMLGLVLIYWKTTNPIRAGILAGATVVSSQLVGWLGFSFNAIGPVILAGTCHLMMAAITSLTISVHIFSFRIPSMTETEARLALDEHLKILGYLFQTITLTLVSGGLATTVLFLSKPYDFVLQAETVIPWTIAVIPFLSFLAYGWYGVFLLRYFLNTASIKDRIIRLAKNN